MAATLTETLLPAAMCPLSGLASLIALARRSDLVAPLPASAQLAAIALATVATSTDRKDGAAARLTARPWPKAFNVIVRRPHLTNVRRLQ